MKELEINLLQPSQTFLNAGTLEFLSKSAIKNEPISVVSLNQILKKTREDPLFEETYREEVKDFNNAVKMYSSISNRYLIEDGNHRTRLAYSEKRKIIPCDVIDLGIDQEKANPVTFELGYIAMKRGIYHVKGMIVVPDAKYGEMLHLDTKDVPISTSKI
jgi:hypothetical protein